MRAVIRCNVRFGSKSGHVRRTKAMSALLPIADMCSALRDVRFVTEADVKL